MKAGYVVYWLYSSPNPLSGLLGSNPLFWNQNFKHFGGHEMMEALKFMEELRKESNTRYVGFVSESEDSVGKPGVDSVVDGKTPDGHTYDWMKRRTQ